MKKEIRWRLGIWWPKDGGYGGIREFMTKEEALSEAAKLERLNYKPEHIHVHKITIEKVETLLVRDGFIGPSNEIACESKAFS